MERRDVANKSEINRNLQIAQQRMQQTVSGAGAGSLSLPDGNARIANHVGGAIASDSQVHQGSQTGGVGVSHDGGNSQAQEPEQSTAIEGNTHAGHDQPLPSSSSVVDGGQGSLRRNSGVGWVASAASAFDAAKDIMETLRSKHTNLASELEVRFNVVGHDLTLKELNY